MSESTAAITQTGDYVPRKDALFRDWANVFALEVAKDPESLGLTEADSAIISALAAEFDAVYVPSMSPATRTTSIVRAKNNTRRRVEKALRGYAQRVKAYLGPDHPGLLADLRLHIDDPTRTPIGPPQTAPGIAVINASGAGVHVIRYVDEGALGKSGAKPHGVAYLQLYAVVARGWVADISHGRHVGDYTRQPIRVAWPGELAGLTATYFARWCNRKGESGPWSLPAPLSITGVGAPVAAPELSRQQLLASLIGLKRAG